MECVYLRHGAGLSILLLHTFTWGWTGAIDPAPKIDGHQRSEVTLQENVSHRFNCESEGWSSQAPPLLTWYLNGQRQSEVTGSRGTGRLVMNSPEGPGQVKFSSERNSSFTLQPRKWDRELVCAATNPAGGESYNATVTLNVQFQPEILRVNAHYSETADPGLALVLFALVRSNPPATITWVDQSGQLVANSTDFLILDSRSYPWLANHSLQVTLSSLPPNISVSVNNSIGTVQTNLTLTEFLQSRVEVPMLGIVTGGVVGFITLLILTLMVLCLLQKDKGKAIEEPVAIPITPQRNNSAKEQMDGMYLPRENMSLPSNMQLNDHSTLCKGRPNSKQSTLQRKTDEEDEDLSLAYAARGFARYPMVGYIYKVNSTSSDEIWL
ncbi:transmembrane protein 25 [Astyanax mexicanus]|uniref:Transmembrane protein 25 n=2 Tax=Astyanax mexicanus TaxID=7994 RepID=A0A8B9JFA8_ASTMX|nr:transmembrane protein 25 [Astyanax mexicanus]XP_049323309.1 transmembrane protein 25 [Astyanax mexicanus]KAG9265336.1 transmembrane protein 25 [Astyanax mexicanus]